jgi:hypothetical protein
MVYCGGKGWNDGRGSHGYNSNRGGLILSLTPGPGLREKPEFSFQPSRIGIDAFNKTRRSVEIEYHDGE